MATQAELLLEQLRQQQAQAAQQKPAARVGSSVSALSGGFTERVLDNAMGIPNMPLKLFEQMHNTGRAVAGKPASPPMSMLPMPSGREVLAGAQSVLPGGSFEAAMKEREDLAGQHPVLSAVGELGGDVATLGAMRLPRGAQYGGMLDASIKNTLNAFSRNLTSPKDVGVKRQVQEIIDSETFRSLAQGAGRAAETGLEGGALSILQGGDPVETAAFAAGMQGVSSGALTWAANSAELPGRLLGQETRKMGPLSRGLIGLGVNAAIMSVAFNLIGDNPDAAESAAYDKAAYGLLLGAMIGIPGKRSKAEGILKNFPNLADTVLTVPRTVMVKLSQKLAEDPTAAKAMEVMGQTPQVFTEEQAGDFLKWIQDGTFAEKVGELYESDTKFRDTIDTPAVLRGVPVRKRRDRGPGFSQ